MIDCLVSPRRVTLLELGKPDATILDVTAGNRMMWKVKDNPCVVFLDKEPALAIPPDVLATWDRLPFPDNYFSVIVFDPPHLIRSNPPPYFTNPKEKYNWYGWFKTRREMVVSIIGADKEFARVAPMVLLKWYEDEVPVDNIVGLLKSFKPELYKKWRANELSRKKRSGGSTWWVKLVRRVGA